MSLISKKIDLILNLLNEDTCGSVLTFEQISNEFHQQIVPKDYLHLGNTLVLLLQNVDLIPNPQQRLIIFYLLIDMYRNERLSFELNPFASVFLSVLQADNEQVSPVGKHFHWMIPPVSKSECAFIRLLIKDPPKDLFKKTPNEILHMDLSTSTDQMEQFKEKMDERKQELPFLVQCHLPAVISDPEINKFGFDRLLAGGNKDNRQTMRYLLSNDTMNRTIHPEYLRLVPPLHECTIDELAWLSPMEDVDDHKSFFSWDSSMLTSSSISSELRFLMAKAYQSAISPSEQQKLLELLNKNPDLISRIGFHPSKLPLLVETNPTISIFLIKLLPSSAIDDYLQSLIQMSMSLYSIEVVNRLSTSMDLPKEFLGSFIFNCIEKCDQTKDKYLQTRFVRLVSVLIQSLIRNKAIQISHCFPQIQTFSSNYRSIKEAQILFQLLQTFDDHQQ